MKSCCSVDTMKIVIFIYFYLVGISVGWGTLYLYELVGERVYLYVGRGRDGQRKVGQGMPVRRKHVVPFRLYVIYFIVNCVTSKISIFCEF